METCHESAVDTETRAWQPELPAALTLAASTLAACGGGGGGSSPAPIPDPVPPPVPPPVSTAPQAVRLLLQSQFSASDTEVAAVQNLGAAAWLDQQFSAPASITGWDWMMGKGYNAPEFSAVASITDPMVWYQLIATPDAVRKRVALALSEIMVASANGVNGIAYRSFAMAGYWDTLVQNAFGNFRTLLEAVTLNPAMGVYLNTRGNQKEDAATGRQPDENYAREVMQLFTIGLYELNPNGSNRLGANNMPIETYDQAMVSSLAHVFTGYNFDKNAAGGGNLNYLRVPMTVTASLHSTVAVQFLGATIPANTGPTEALKIALDTIFNHPNVGPFFGRQLIQRLVTSNPSPAYIARVSAAFNNNGAGVRGDMKAVIRAVLQDAEAVSATQAVQANWGKLREPIVRFVQWARTFKATSTNDAWKINDLSSDATRLGQSPLRSGSVFNFFRPGYVPPNTALAGAALVAPEFQITNESSVAGYINFMQTVIKNGYSDLVPNYSAELALVADVDKLLDRLNLLLTAGQLSGTTLATIRTTVAGLASATAAEQLIRVQAAVLLVMAAPQYLVQK